MKAIFKTFVVFTLAEHFAPVWAMFGGAPQQVVAKKSAAKQAAAQQVVAKASANVAQQVVAKEVAAQLVEDLSLADLQNFAERHNFQDVVDMLWKYPELFKVSEDAQGGEALQVIVRQTAKEIFRSVRRKKAAAQQAAPQQFVAKEVAAQLLQGHSLAMLQDVVERHNRSTMEEILSKMPDLFKGSQHAQGDEALQAIRRETAQEIIWSARRMLGGKKAADKKTASQQAVAKEAEAYAAIAAEILEAESPLRLEKHALPGPPGPVPASGR